MSQFSTADPLCNRREGVVAMVIRSRQRDLGGFTVRRALPAPECRSAGPFVFVDEMGPVAHAPGEGIDVAPHPHIGIATVTWLFDGEILHRDSLGSAQIIRPGELNLMTAGRGIVHSEREPPAEDSGARRLHGLQIWMALPRELQDCEPAFEHHRAADIPVVDQDGCRTVIAIGRYEGLVSPARARADALFLIQALEVGTTVAVPQSAPRRAVYVVDGRIEIDGCMLRPGEMAVLNPGRLHIVAHRASRFAIIGGRPISKRHMWWNFVHTDAGRIERARADWREGRFPTVPGEAGEFIPPPAR